MIVRRVQVGAFVLAGVFIPLFAVLERLISWRWSDVVFFATVHFVVLVGILSSILRYRRERNNPLPNWRRIPYATALGLLLTLCVLPLATWPIAMSGVETRGLHAAFMALVVVNLIAAAMTCFGRGWSRVGLAIVSYWTLFLWIFPLALRE